MRPSEPRNTIMAKIRTITRANKPLQTIIPTRKPRRKNFVGKTLFFLSALPVLPGALLLIGIALAVGAVVQQAETANREVGCVASESIVPG